MHLNKGGAFSSTLPSRLELCKLWVSLSNWFGKEVKLTIQKLKNEVILDRQNLKMKKEKTKKKRE